MSRRPCATWLPDRRWAAAAGKAFSASVALPQCAGAGSSVSPIARLKPGRVSTASSNASLTLDLTLVLALVLTLRLKEVVIGRNKIMAFLSRGLRSSYSHRNKTISPEPLEQPLIDP